MNGAVNKWNVIEYVSKGQVSEIIYERNELQEKTLCGKVYVEIELC